jgi:ribonuclease D
MEQRYIDHPHFVNSDDELARLCQQWSSAPVLALDTEFIRTDTFYPIGALIQVSDGSGCFLIDPLAITDFSAFSALLANTAILKVLHSCSEDLEVFNRLFGVIPQPLIDTQIAAALDGHGFSLSYQRLTEILLQIHVAKGETRSNWLQRPLTSAQIHYAALDVAYLPELYQRLSTSLQQKGRLSWLREECDFMVSASLNPVADDQYYKKVTSSWKLSRRELAVLQTLTLWREQQARSRDKPRGRIVKDHSCYDIARLQPKNLRQLSGIDDVGFKTVGHYGEMILTLIEQALALPEDKLPPLLPKALPPQTSRLLKVLKAHIGHRAQQLNLAQELLVRKRDYEALLRSGFNGGEYQLPASLAGWRKTIVGDELIELLNC